MRTTGRRTGYLLKARAISCHMVQKLAHGVYILLYINKNVNCVMSQLNCLQRDKSCARKGQKDDPCKPNLKPRAHFLEFKATSSLPPWVKASAEVGFCPWRKCHLPIDIVS